MRYWCRPRGFRGRLGSSTDDADLRAAIDHHDAEPALVQIGMAAPTQQAQIADSRILTRSSDSPYPLRSNALSRGNVSTVVDGWLGTATCGGLGFGLGAVAARA